MVFKATGVFAILIYVAYIALGYFTFTYDIQSLVGYTVPWFFAILAGVIITPLSVVAAAILWVIHFGATFPLIHH